jgi:hypothetical protein
MKLTISYILNSSGFKLKSIKKKAEKRNKHVKKITDLFRVKHINEVSKGIFVK